jgi:hypothetical protein
MLLAAAVVLGLTALGGLFVGMLRLRGGNPPLFLAGVHGFLAATGLVLLLVHLATTGFRGTPLVAFVTLAAGAGVGFRMLWHHRAGNLIPITLLAVHLLTVATGYAFLLGALIG